MRHTVKVLSAALLIAAAGAHAQSGSEGDSRKSSARESLDELRPTGPVTVKADRVEWVQNNMMKYSGSVSMTSNTLTVLGDSMDVRQAADGQFEAWVHGAPAKLDHAADPDASGNAAQPVHAEAREIHYDSRSGTVDMTGNAHLKRGDDVVDGNTIGYVVPERRIRAAGGGNNGQVTITFQPPPPKKDAADGKKDGAP
ncbi:lipopolysaccharide transport periplasmic protein LptA [Solimonas soli]|uniref:lipopolysaccharide transport periplasmic protein LptA n=1 Tax=Solimonas soli TaxID=413479 RepID=UPI0004850B79|nr:lipopolysaccharide transport periplasmic protein LptA [Solimonas soli]